MRQDGSHLHWHAVNCYYSFFLVVVMADCSKHMQWQKIFIQKNLGLGHLSLLQQTLSYCWVYTTKYWEYCVTVISFKIRAFQKYIHNTISFSTATPKKNKIKLQHVSLQLTYCFKLRLNKLWRLAVQQLNSNVAIAATSFLKHARNQQLYVHNENHN